MPAPLCFYINFGVAIFFLASSLVQAQDFLLPAGLQASWCNTSWSVSGSTYTCTGGNGKVTFPNNAVVSSSGAIVFVANAGFELNNAKLGSESSRISLRAPNGGALVKSDFGAEVSGFIESSGTVDLKGTKVDEYIKANGKIDLVGGSVAGSVESINNGVKAAGGVIFGEGITANGNIDLAGGSVKLKVTSTSNKVIAIDTDMLGGALGHSGISIAGGNISGDLTAHSNTIALTSVTMTSGNINAGGSNIKVSGGSVKANITDANNVDIENGASVSGNVQARYTVKLKNSKVTGNIYGSSGYELQNVDLRESFVYGSVAVGTSWQTITGDDISRVYVSCTYGSVNPASLCEGGGIPPDPVDPAECDVSLEVGDMIAGKPHFATVTLLRDPLDCVPPSKLKVYFGYLDKEPAYHKPESLRVNDNVDIVEGGSEVFSGITWGEEEAIRLDIGYKDAGRLTLALLDSEDDVLDQDSFVSAPAALCIVPEAGALCESADSSCPKFRIVGQVFSINTRAVAWRDTGHLCAADNRTTYNYRKSGLELEPVVVDPPENEGGKNGKLFEPANGIHNHLAVGDVANWDGVLSRSVALSEVGVFRLRIKEHDYLGVSVPISESKPIGRFYPNHLKVEFVGGVAAGCSIFSYQDQPVDISSALTLAITGYGREPGGEEYPTLNYDHDGFWGFDNRPDEEWMADDRKQDLSARLLLDGDKTEDAGVTESGRNDFDGKRTYTWDAQQLVYSRNPQLTAIAEDLRFSIRLRFSNEELTDKDGVCYERDSVGGCRHFEQTIDKSQIRLGRIRSENLIVPHGNSAQAPIVLEHWNGAAWQLDVDNDCTLLAPPTADSAERVSFPDSGLPDARVDEAEEWNQSYLQITDATGREPKSEPQGRVLLHHLLQHSNGASATWLCQQRSEDSAPLGGVCSYQEGGDAETRSSITFGIYQGPKPLIFRRELYRGMQ